MTFIDPGSRLVRRRSLADQLLRQGVSGAPVQSFTQGLDRLGKTLVGSLINRRQGRQQEAANTALVEGLRGTPPGAGLSAGPGEAGGLEGAIARLSTLEGNPLAGRLARQLAIAGAEQETAFQNAARLQALKGPKFGSEVPFPEDVAAQKADLARAGATTVSVGAAADKAAATEAAKQGFGPSADVPQTGQPARPLTPGQRKIDEAFAKDFNALVAQGGVADIEKGISQLQVAVDNLESGENITGPLIGLTPAGLLAKFNPKALETQEAVAEVAQRNLRAVLGGQFAEREGDRLIDRAFNPRLSEEENAKRVRRLMGSIQKALLAKLEAVDYFEKNGTLRGFQGTLPSIEDIAEDARLTEAGVSRETPADLAPDVLQDADVPNLPDGTIIQDQATQELFEIRGGQKVPFRTRR